MHTKVKKEVRRLNRIIEKMQNAESGIEHHKLAIKQHKQEQRIQDMKEQYSDE